MKEKTSAKEREGDRNGRTGRRRALKPGVGICSRTRRNDPQLGRSFTIESFYAEG